MAKSASLKWSSTRMDFQMWDVPEILFLGIVLAFYIVSMYMYQFFTLLSVPNVWHVLYKNWGLKPCGYWKLQESFLDCLEFADTQIETFSVKVVCSSRSPVGQGQCFDFTVKDHTPWYNRVEFVEKYESCCEYFWVEKSEQSIQQNCWFFFWWENDTL